MQIKVMPNENIDVSELLRFFELLYKEKNASTEEVYNFSRACLEYVFKIQNIDIKKYNINIHFKSLTKLEDGRSYMEQSSTDKNSFDIYFDKNDLAFRPEPLSSKVYNDNKKFKGVNKNEFHNSELELSKSLTNFAYFINTMFHEYAHVIQYIKCPNLIEKSDTDRFVTGKNIQRHLETIKDTDEKRLLSKQFYVHYSEKDFTRLIEKDANQQAFAYTNALLRHLINHAHNFNLQWFIYNMLKTEKQIRKEDFYEYRLSNKKNKTAIKILNEHNVPEDCFLCF